jgi:hypothetical protein
MHKVLSLISSSNLEKTKLRHRVRNEVQVPYFKFYVDYCLLLSLKVLNVSSDRDDSKFGDLSFSQIFLGKILILPVSPDSVTSLLKPVSYLWDFSPTS